MRKRIMRLANSLAAESSVIDRDLKDEYHFDSTALMVLRILESTLSVELCDMIRDMLLGFEESMQLEIADNLLDFATMHVIHTTGCPSADYVLEACYRWIAEEQGIVDIVTE